MAVDFTKMTMGPARRTGKEKSKEPVGKAWWKAEEGSARAQAVIAAATQLKEQQSERSQMNLLHARLYGNNDLASFGGRTYTLAMAQNTQTRIAINVVASGTDTLASKIAKSKPRATFTTSGASWKMQQKAKELTKFVDAVFYEAKVYGLLSVLQFLSACIFGTGAIKLFINEATGRLEMENAFIDELSVDDADAKYGKPSQLFQRRLISKDKLLEMYPGKECEEAIEGAMAPDDETAEKGLGDLVEVVEAWHLKSGPTAEDGLHTAAINGHELFSEEWKHDFFPFSFLRFKPRILGFWGQGVAEVLTGIQVSINRTVRSIDEQMRRKGKGRIFVQSGSKIVPQHLTNGIADILTYLGHPPIVDNANAIAQEDFMYLDSLIKKAYQEIGVSQLSAAMQKPSGLDAQVAIREFTDIESERFALLSQAWDQNFLTLADIAIALISEAGGKGYKVRLPNKKYMVDIDWKDIDLERDDYIQQMVATSSLPNHPGEKYQTVKEWEADGMIDKTTAKRLLNFPDLETESDLGNAAIDDVDCTIGYILDDKEPHLEPPDKYQDLKLLITRATASLLYAKHHGAEPKRLEMLRRLIDQASEMAIAATAPPPPPPGAPPMPGGAPAPGGAPQTQSQTVNVPLQPTVPPLIG